MNVAYPSSYVTILYAIEILTNLVYTASLLIIYCRTSTRHHASFSPIHLPFKSWLLLLLSIFGAAIIIAVLYGGLNFVLTGIRMLGLLASTCVHQPANIQSPFYAINVCCLVIHLLISSTDPAAHISMLVMNLAAITTVFSGRAFWQTTLNLYRCQFLYVAHRALVWLRRVQSNNLSIETALDYLISEYMPHTNGMDGVAFNTNSKMFVLRGLLEHHWIVFVVCSLSQVLLGFIDIWKSQGIANVFSLAKTDPSIGSIIATLLGTFVCHSVLYLFTFQYRLFRDKLNLRFRTMLGRSLCRYYVLAPSSPYTVSMLNQDKMKLVSPYISALLKFVGGVSTLTSIVGNTHFFYSLMGWRAILVTASMLSLYSLAEWITNRDRVRVTTLKYPNTLHSRIRDMMPSMGVLKMLALEDVFLKVRQDDNYDNITSLVVTTTTSVLRKIAKACGLYLVLSFTIYSSHNLSHTEASRLVVTLQLVATSCSDLIRLIGTVFNFTHLEGVLENRIISCTSKLNINSSNHQSTEQKQPHIEMEQATFSRYSQQEDRTNPVVDVNKLTVRDGELVGIVGPVGSGKTTFLRSMFGEFQLISGNCQVDGDIAYVGQDPWIMADTLKENILFGRPFEENLYATAVHAACLEEDIALLPHKDETMMTDHGTTLSGGQRTRLALARAIYSQADIYLVDNALVALDANVRKAVWERALSLKGILSDSIRLVSFSGRDKELNDCHQVIRVTDGQVDVVDKHECRGDQMVAAPENRSASPLNQSAVADSENLWTPTGPQIISSSATACRYFAKICGISTIVAAVVTGILESAIPLYVNVRHTTLIHTVTTTGSEQTATSDKDGMDEFGTAILNLFLLEILLVIWLQLVSELVYVRYPRSYMQSVLLDSLGYAKMSEFWNRSSFRMISVLKCSERATFVGPHHFVADNMSYLTSVAFTVYQSLNMTIYTVVVLAVAGIYVTRYSTRVSSSLRTLQWYRLQNLQTKIDSAVSNLFSGALTIRAFGVYGLLEAKINEVYKRQAALQMVVDSFIYANQLYRQVVELALSLIMVGSILIVINNNNSNNDQHSTLLAADIQFYYHVMTRSLSIAGDLSNIPNSAINHLIALQEHYDFCHLAKEAPRHIAYPDLTETWPPHGGIVFNHCSLRYSQDNRKLALDDVSFVIRPGERIGIVGRTGAGKSSLINALMRMVELESGHIAIDGIDLAGLGVHDIRQKISVVSQANGIFEGTLRSNIDPFGKHSDSEISAAIRAAQLEHLDVDMTIESLGKNLSKGEQQLVAICRALLQRDNKILVLDEATANVDTDTTTQMIESVIDREFRGRSTILIVAHRLEATAGCDRIMVLDGGRLAEFDTPAALSANPNSLYRQLELAAAVSN